jgi:hypothetical protein
VGGLGQAAGGAGPRARRLPAPEQARERFAVVPQAEVVAVEGAKHLFVGFTERVLDEVVARVVPGAAPLPTAYED